MRDEETIVYGEIDLKVNEMARGIINITGLYSRWDILSLLVRQNAYEPIVPMEALEAVRADGVPAADGTPAAGGAHESPARRAADASQERGGRTEGQGGGTGETTARGTRPLGLGGCRRTKPGCQTH